MVEVESLKSQNEFLFNELRNKETTHAVEISCLKVELAKLKGQ